MFDGVHFQYIQVYLSFLFSERSDFFLIWLFYSFSQLSLSTFHYKRGTFFFAKFHSHRHCLLPLPLEVFFYSFFLFWANRLISSEADFFLLFMMFVSVCAFPKYVIEWFHRLYK